MSFFWAVLLAGDTIAISISFFLSYFLREEIIPEFFNSLSVARLEPLRTYIPLLLVFLLIWIAVGWEEELYEDKGFWDELKGIWTTDIITGFLTLSIAYIGKREFMLSRVLLLMSVFLAAFTVPILRLILKKIFFSLGIGLRPVAIIGKEKEGQNLATELQREWYAGYRVKKIYENIDKIERKIKEDNIREVFILSSCFAPSTLRALVLRLEGIANINIIPEVHRISLAYGKLKNIGIYMALSPYHKLYKKENLLIKRAIDLILASLLLLLLWPAFLLIAIAIKLDSKGPILYKQRRLGIGEKPFHMLKFRSMRVDADRVLQRILRKSPELREEWKKYKKLKNDPRVTRVGRFLRKWSLDELPQLFNVLKGEMSLVGPRPYLPKERGDMGGYRKIIFRVKPGITGLWQIRGRNTLPFEVRLALDEFYVRNWSLWLDFVILVKTTKAVLERKGAY